MYRIKPIPVTPVPKIHLALTYPLENAKPKLVVIMLFKQSKMPLYRRISLPPLASDSFPLHTS